MADLYLLGSDVLKYIEDIRENKTSSVPVKPVQETSTDQSYIDIPLSNMRHTIAKRLTESKVQNKLYLNCCIKLYPIERHTLSLLSDRM